MIERLSLVAEVIGWCVMIPGAILGAAFAFGGFLLWLRGPEPVRIERPLGVVTCDCPKCSIERLNARRTGDAA